MTPIFTVLAAPVLKARRIPIITWYAHRKVTALVKLAYRWSDRVVSVNESSYRYRHDKLVSIGHGIDVDLFAPNGVKPDDPPVVVSVGRLSPIKDLTTLVEAIEILRTSGSRVRGALVGCAPERDLVYEKSLRQRVGELGLQDAIVFAGAIPLRDMVGWYRRSFAHVNLCGTGALDKAPLEAMASGRPTLVANEGFRETLGRYAPVLLFKEEDADDLAARLRGILSLSFEERRIMGEYLRDRVVAMHSLGQLPVKIVALFQGLGK
jgi:glycosyltransferase involved in cell wall biosynthesis